MSDIVIIPDSGTISFFPDKPETTPISSKIVGSGDDLNISSPLGNINISGNFLVNNNSVSYSGHSHSSSNITDFGTAVSGLFSSNLVRVTGIQTITDPKLFSGGLSIGNAPLGGYSGTRQLYIRSQNDDSIQSSFIIANSNSVPVLDVRNDSNVIIGQPSGFGGLIHRLNVRGTTITSDAGALNIVNASNLPILFARNDRRVGINTRNPTADLEVRGSGVFTGGIFVNNSPVSISGHQHAVSDITSLQSFLNAKQASGNYAISGHTHTVSNISSLQSFLDNKQASGNYAISGHTHSSSDISNFNSSVSGLLPITILSSGSGISISNSGSNYTISAIPIASTGGDNEDHLLTKHPHGFVNLNDSTISFFRLTRFFEIGPSGNDYEFYIQGNKIKQSGIRRVALPFNTNLYYIYLNSQNILSVKSSPFNYTEDLPISVIYVNNSCDTVFFSDERNNSTIDSSIINYFSSSIGLDYGSGLQISNFNFEGDGSLASHATIGIQNGSITNYNKKIDITHSDVPTNYYQQKLFPIAHIAVLYRNGVASWLFDKDDAFLPGQNPTPSTTKPRSVPYKSNAQHNFKDQTTGIWRLQQPFINSFVCYWVCATTNILYPIISIMGQRYDSLLNDAISYNIWENLDLNGLPVNSIKPIYKLIYQSNQSYGNGLGARLVSVTDLRNINHNFSKNDHSSLYNLGSNDDHPQYVHLSNNRKITATHSFENGVILNNIYPINTSDQSLIVGADKANIKLLTDNIFLNADREISFNYHSNYDFAKITFHDVDTGKDIIKISKDTDSGSVKTYITNLDVPGIFNASNVLKINGDGELVISIGANDILDTNGEEGTATLNNTDIGGYQGCRINNTTIGEYVPSFGYFTELQVTGLVTANSGNFTNSLTVNGTGVISSTGGTTNYISKFTGNSTIANSLIFDNGTGVGIGTTSPTANLHVNGSGLFSNNITASGFIKSGGTSSQFLKADGSVDSTTYLYNDNTIVLTTGNQGISGLKVFYDNVIVGIGNENLVSLGGGLGIGGSGIGLFNDGGLPLAAEYWKLGADEHLIHYAYGGGTVTTPRIAVLESNGNVGIGTSSPSSKLQVIGLITASSIMANDLLVNQGVIRVNNSFLNTFNMTINSSGINIVDTAADTAVSRVSTIYLPSDLVSNTSIVIDNLGSIWEVDSGDLAVGDLVLFTNFNSSSYNGIYKVEIPIPNIEGNIRFVRASGFTNGTVLNNGISVNVINGSKKFILNKGIQGTSTVGSSSLSFTVDNGQSVMNILDTKDVVFSEGVSSQIITAEQKFFKIKHPDSESGYSHLQYGSLESPYNGVRLTGNDKLNKGVCEVYLPNYLKHLIHEKDVSIQLTNYGHHKMLYVDKIDLKNNKFIIKGYRSKSGGPYQFYWSFTGIRKDVPNLIPEQ